MKSSREDVPSPQDREVFFEVVRKQLEKVLTSNLFAAAPQHQLLLSTIVNETLAGRTEALKEVVLAKDVLGRQDYDPSRHTQVRVGVNAVRRKLAEYYTRADPADRIKIEIPLGHYVAEFSALPVESTKETAQPRHYGWWALGVVVLVGAVVGGLTIGRRTLDTKTGVPVRITFDTGWTAHPAISRDGSTVVYSSDRGPRGDRDIWIQQAGQPPRQLTNDPAHDMTPDISPDGQRVVFRSWRKPEGLWMVAASGGEARLLAAGGYSPRFSPDGQRVAFNGDEQDGLAHAYVVPAEGGAAERLDYGVDAASCPVWSPDGSKLLFAADSLGGGERDFWITNTDGPAGKIAKPLGIAAKLRAQHLPEITTSADCPQDWINDRLFFVTNQLETGSLFEVPLDNSGALGPIRAVPSALGAEGVRAIGDGQKPVSIVFALERRETNIWETNLTGSAPLEQLTHDSSLRSGFNGTWPALSGDGEVLAYLSERSGRFDICMRDLRGQSEKMLSATPLKDSRLKLDYDGSHVVFARTTEGQNTIVFRTVADGRERVLTTACPVLYDWSYKANALLCGDGPRLFQVSGENGSRTSLPMQGPFIWAQLSPDGQWVAYVKEGERGHTTSGFVAQIRSGKEIEFCEKLNGLSAHWAPNGNSIYYWSVRDGFRCLYAQALEPQTKVPRGEPVALVHRHGSQHYPWSGGTLAVGEGRMAFTLKEELANIWRVELGN